MDVKSLFEHVNRISNRIATNWNYFLVISIGLVTALALENKKLDTSIGAILLCCLAMFYVSNHYRLYKLTKEIGIAERELSQHLKQTNNLTKEFIEFYDIDRPSKFISSIRFYAGKSESNHVNLTWPLFHALVSFAVLGLILSRWKIFY